MRLLTICALFLLVTLSCSNESTKPDQNSLIGFWVPYEIKNPDGQLQEGPFSGNSIFGFYAESIQFNIDGTYFPAVWTDKNNYFTYDQAGGNYEYTPAAGRILLTKGQWDMNLEVIKFSNDDLWIKTNDTTYKLHREVK